jgi:hypothetical protein
MFTKALTAFVMSMVGTAFFFNQARMFYLQNTDPIKVTRAVAVSETIRPGEQLAISFTVDRKRLCDSELSMFVETGTERDRRVLWRHREPGGSGMLGITHNTSSFDIPTLPPGVYRFRMVGYLRCAEDMHTIIVPTVEFSVSD